MSPTPQERLWELAESRPVPFSVILSLTDRCNLRCGHCYLAPSFEPPLATDRLMTLLGELAAEGCLVLTLTGGEPMLHGDLLAVVAEARRLTMDVRLQSNATMVDSGLAGALKDRGVSRVQVSLHGGREAHEALTGVKGSFDAALRGTRALGEAGIAVALNFLATRHNQGEVDEVHGLASDLGCHLLLDPRICLRADGHRGPASCRPTDDQLVAFLARAGELGYRFDSTRPGPDDRICAMMHLSCFISPSGQLMPCPAFDLVVGELSRSSFREAWLSPAAKRLRDLRVRDLRECSGCDLLGLCGRCSAEALSETGDMLGLSPESCRLGRVLRAMQGG